ncbi:response regulator receiver protein [Maricaulis sp.]|uniref:response regulator receiver protein n=1 Tax=Maricaulis sp. TaxID=1486257 RepID=UPI0026149755|nr:response regulator receiver protein [Maricaulis sp.]MDF1767237.1 response regulator receiver protein [Maricaulis sp.]
MAEIDYTRASVLLFDPIHVNQRTSRYALFEIGFRQIECVASMADFKNGITEGAPSLIVAEASANDKDIFNLVRSVRRGDVGSNPFVVFLLTTWSRDTGHIRKAIECGADDVIVRPFSTMFAEERVKTLIRGRKDFVVTSDYIGPDRRKDSERSTDAPLITVPNFLKATVENDEQALNNAQQWVREAREAVTTERVRRVAMRIVISVELEASKKTEEGKVPVALDIKDLDRAARELRAHVLRAGRREAAEVAEALLDQIGALGDGRNADAGILKLVKELAMGTYAAFANGDTIERSKDEIGRTVSNLRKRLQARAEAARRKAVLIAEEAAAATADDAGQEGSPDIKRAAM